MEDTVCETCRFYQEGQCIILNKIIRCPLANWCESWQDEDGNTILGEDW